jgi:hypothetical protein
MAIPTTTEITYVAAIVRMANLDLRMAAMDAWITWQWPDPGAPSKTDDQAPAISR